ncbi:UNVERIFIED_CONTAM: hypothetical protein FKN15_065144 [Acipenser sinensis]
MRAVALFAVSRWMSSSAALNQQNCGIKFGTLTRPLWTKPSTGPLPLKQCFRTNRPQSTAPPVDQYSRPKPRRKEREIMTKRPENSPLLRGECLPEMERICWHCGDPGHVMADCCQLEAKLSMRQLLGNGSGSKQKGRHGPPHPIPPTRCPQQCLPS